MMFREDTKFRGRVWNSISRTETFLEWRDTVEEAKIDLRKLKQTGIVGFDFIQNERLAIALPNKA